MTYTNFKALVLGQSLKWFYKQIPSGYEFSTYDGPLSFSCIIYGNTCTIPGALKEQSAVDDFEANYKAAAINVG